MALPLGLLDEPDVSRRLRIVATLAGALDLRSVEATRGDEPTALLQAVRVRAPVVVVLGDDGGGRAERFARSLRTDLRADLALVVVGANPRSLPFAWTGERRPPDGWVTDASDAGALRAVVASVLAGERSWPDRGEARDVRASSWLSRVLTRARRARMIP